MGEMKLGDGGVGKMFLGDVQMGGGIGIPDLLKEISIASDFDLHNSKENCVLIANLSTSVDIELYRGDTSLTIPKQHIEWYTIDVNKRYVVELPNNGNKLVRYFASEKVVRKDSSIPITNFKTATADNGDLILSQTNYDDTQGVVEYFGVAIIFDEI